MSYLGKTAVFVFVAAIAAGIGGGAYGVVTHVVDVSVPEPVPEDGTVRIEGYTASADPGNPMLPEKGISVIVDPDIDWATLRVDVTVQDADVLAENYWVQPAAAGESRYMDDDGRLITEESYGEGKNILGDMNLDVYGEDSFYPESIAEALPYSELREWKIANIRFMPVQYNAVTRELRVTREARLVVSYELAKTAKTIAEGRAIDGPLTLKRLSEGTVNYDEMAGRYLTEEVEATGADGGAETTADTYDYCIITTNYIVANSTKLADYVAHKEGQYYSVLVKTVEDIEAEYTQEMRPELFESTDDKADRIKAFLKDKYAAYGLQWVLLIGNPNPSSGDVPMKYCEPDAYDAPTDAFYSDMTGKWDLDGDTIYGEHPDDAGSGGVDFAYPELYVCRIPNYTTDLTSLDSILQKTIDYENDIANESWRKSCLMPNPIDYSDNYGAEGNLSPITMAEYIKNAHLIPNGFSYYRIYEHKFNWPPISVSPDPEQSAGVYGQHTCVTYYDSVRRFNAALHTTSEDAAAYTISEMTDNSSSTYHEISNMQPNAWLQFKQVYSGLESVRYVPDRIIIRSTDKAYLPQKFVVQMASNGSFTDAYTVVTETAASTNAVQNGSYWELQYDYEEGADNLSAVGNRKYIRLKYTGTAAQATVRINEFLMYTETHNSIRSYVIPEWLNGYGIVYYNTHGSSTSASDVISNYECSQLDDEKPAFVFAKACQNAWPEVTSNLCYSFLKNGAIAALAATRTSYGLGDAGYPKLFRMLCGENLQFGETITEMKSEMALLGELGWGGLFADCMRFNIYGDPTVAILGDRDLDTMPYWFEVNFGLDPNVDDRDGDIDEDGLSNGDEYAEGTIINDPDTDNDGMLDGYEVQYELDPFHNDSGGDPDGDNRTNLEEAIAGTDPRDPSSFFRVKSIERTESGALSSTVTIKWDAVKGKIYVLEFSDDAYGGAMSWTPADGVIAESDGEMEFVDNGDARFGYVDPYDAPYRHYRMEIYQE